MDNPERSDKVLIQTAGSTLAKITFYICCTIAFGMMLSTCQVDEKIIIQCEDSCGISPGMKEVTGTSCECNQYNEIERITSPFVLP